MELKKLFIIWFMLISLGICYAKPVSLNYKPVNLEKEIDAIKNIDDVKIVLKKIINQVR